MNLPNKLTMLRMLMIPLFIACFYLPESWLIGTLNGVPLLLKYVLAAVVFLLAYVTDTLDGRIARARGLVTDFGKLIRRRTSCSPPPHSSCSADLKS